MSFMSFFRCLHLKRQIIVATRITLWFYLTHNYIYDWTVKIFSYEAIHARTYNIDRVHCNSSRMKYKFQSYKIFRAAYGLTSPITAMTAGKFSSGHESWAWMEWLKDSCSGEGWTSRSWTALRTLQRRARDKVSIEKLHEKFQFFPKNATQHCLQINLV